MAIRLDDTGERMIPERHKGKNLYGAHMARYAAGMPVIKDQIVLDIACGTGYGAKLMSKEAKKVFGVDVDGKTVEYAKENYSAVNITYKVGSATDIPLADRTVDVVVSYETIEHLDDYDKFLSEIKRVLKPGGRLLISTPNEDEYLHENEFHLHEFRYVQLGKLIDKYFKHRHEYFQTHWIYSSVLPRELQTSEWSKAIQTINTVPVPPEQCIFFYMLCSDKPIKNGVRPTGVIGEHYRLRDLQAANQGNKEVRAALDKTRSRLNKASHENELLQAELAAIKRSKSWKLAMATRKTAGAARKPFNSFKRDKN